MAMTLRLDDDETAALRAAAEAQGVSMQEFARKAIRDATSEWASARDAYLERFAADNASLLERLSQ